MSTPKQRHARIREWADQFMPEGIPILADWSKPGPKGRFHFDSITGGGDHGHFDLWDVFDNSPTVHKRLRRVALHLLKVCKHPRPVITIHYEGTNIGMAIGLANSAKKVAKEFLR